MEIKHLQLKLKNILFASALMLGFTNGFSQQIITQTFSYTGSVQIATLCADQVTIEVWGAQGGGSESSLNSASGLGGRGGYSYGVYNMVPSTTLNVYVGGLGQSADTGTATGGWNGGGSGHGQSSGEPGNGGGGASDVRVNGLAFSDRIIVAGGGGGGGEDSGDSYGHGGGTTGVGYVQYDATQSAAGPNGSIGIGAGTILGDGGGGGGGYYGGGSLQANTIGSDTQGGGGGSGYIGGVINGVTTAGNASMPNPAGGNMTGRMGNGLVRIRYINSAGTSISASSTVVCSGQPVILTASGPGSYLWSNGQTTNTISVTPSDHTTYYVTGTNPLTGCSATVSQQVQVIQSPQIGIMTLKSMVCEGESITLAGVGANTFTWSEGPVVANAITVIPTLSNNTYTALGSNAFGCVTPAVVQISVNPLPALTVSGNTIICVGTGGNFTAGGASAYEWKSSSSYVASNPAFLMPNTTTTYTLDGKDAFGCKGSTIFVVLVEPCVGIEGLDASSAQVAVYPNPSNGVITVELHNGLSKTIEVVDVTGRTVLSQSTSSDLSEVNISNLATGIYYVKVKSENVSDIIKVVKQ